MAYTTSKTNWTESDSLTDEEMNRIEENIEALKSGNETISGVKTFSGNNTHSGDNSFSGDNTHKNIETNNSNSVKCKFAKYTGTLDGSSEADISISWLYTKVLSVRTFVNLAGSAMVGGAAFEEQFYLTSGNLHIEFTGAAGYNYTCFVIYEE